VNAAAYTAVDKAETNQETAFRISAEAVAVIADYAGVLYKKPPVIMRRTMKRYRRK